MTKVLGIDFKYAVLNLYHQIFSLKNDITKITVNRSVNYIPQSEQTQFDFKREE